MESKPTITLYTVDRYKKSNVWLYKVDLYIAVEISKGLYNIRRTSGCKGYKNSTLAETVVRTWKPSVVKARKSLKHGVYTEKQLRRYLVTNN